MDVILVYLTVYVVIKLGLLRCSFPVLILVDILAFVKPHVQWPCKVIEWLSML